MSLIVEDGSIVENANAYVSRADCIAYHAARGNSFNSSPLDLLDNAIIRATTYIDNFYKGRWGGRKIQREQSLQFPREYLTDEDGYEIPEDEVPQEVVKATCEAALLEINNPNGLNPVSNDGKRVVAESVSAGAVSSSKTYSDMPETRKTITIIEDYLKGFVTSIYNGRIHRA